MEACNSATLSECRMYLVILHLLYSYCNLNIFKSDIYYNTYTLLHQVRLSLPGKGEYGRYSQCL